MRSLRQPKSAYLNIDPRIKILLMTLIALIALTGTTKGIAIYPRLLILLIPSILFMLNREIIKGMIFFFVIFAGWYAEAFLILNGDIIASTLIFIPASIITRFIVPVFMGYFIIRTTQVETLIEGLERMRMPRKMTIPIAVMFRFMPTIKEESANIKDAMKMRQITLRNSFKQPITYIEYRFVPLINRVVKISSELTVASISRGLNLEHARTSRIQLKLTWVDFTVVAYSVIVLVVYYIV